MSKEESKEETYSFNEVNDKIKKLSSELKEKYSFLEIKDPNYFKHYIDQDLYHFDVHIIMAMDEEFLNDKYQAKKMKFPLEFDIDVGKATKQYVDYMLKDLFSKFSHFCNDMENEYKAYKEPQQIHKQQMHSYSR